LTLNLRHVRPEHLAIWGVRAVHPQSHPVPGNLSLSPQSLASHYPEIRPAPVL
jgi:hypothetical protein